MVDWLVPLLGTLVTVTGLVVAAPHAAGRMLPDVWASIRHSSHQLRGWAARWLPWLRREGVLHAASGAAAGGLVFRGKARARGVVGGGTVAEQLASLHRAVESIHGELDELRSEHKALGDELHGRLDQLSAELSELRQHVEAQEEQARQVDARGFPLAAVGALVAGLPAAPLTWGWWVLVAVGGAGAAVAVRWLWEPGSTRAEVAMGWREAIGRAPASPAPES